MFTLPLRLDARSRNCTGGAQQRCGEPSELPVQSFCPLSGAAEVAREWCLAPTGRMSWYGSLPSKKMGSDTTSRVATGMLAAGGQRREAAEMGQAPIIPCEAFPIFLVVAGCRREP
jgi:hypothetical protein